MLINTEARLRVHLKLFKRQCDKSGLDTMLYYPVFCEHYSKNQEKYDLPNGVVLDMACEILVEGE